MTTGYVALYTIGGDGLGIASAATDVSLANRNLALGTGSLTATNLTGTLQTAAQTNVTSLGTLTVLNTAGAVAVDGSQRQYHVQLAPVFDSGINVIRAAALAVLSDVRGNSGRVITDLMGIYVSHSFYSYVGLSLTNCYGVYISPGEPSITGTIDNGYGLYVENPVYGVTKRCAHFAGNVSIGSTTAANNRLEVIGGGLRVQGANSATASGQGVEIQYTGGYGFVGTYNRQAASYLATRFFGSFLEFETQGSIRYSIDTSGHFVPFINNTYDLGTSTNYWRSGYIGSHHLGANFIEFSNIESGDRINYIDFHCSNGVDYSARIIRGSGVNGPLDISNTGTGGIGLNSTGNTSISFATNNTNRCYVDSSGHFIPYAHNTYDLGTTALRWRDAWVSRAAFNGSDERVKTQIQPTRFGLDFVRKLKPVSWQWKDTSGDDTALHHGFIAQQVKQVLTELGATNQDFGGYHDPEDRKQTGFLALAYNEFISPMVAAIQELDQRYPEPAPDDKVAPLIATSPGRRGEIRSTDQHLFVCVADNRWVRTPIETQF